MSALSDQAQGATEQPVGVGFKLTGFGMAKLIAV